MECHGTRFNRVRRKVDDNSEHLCKCNIAAKRENTVLPPVPISFRIQCKWRRLWISDSFAFILFSWSTPFFSNAQCSFELLGGCGFSMDSSFCASRLLNE